MTIADRLLTIVVTATLTSAAWIVGGGSLISAVSGDDDEAVEPVAQERERSDRGQASDVQDGASLASSLDLENSLAVPEGEADQLIIPVLDVSADELVDSYSDARGGGERLHEAIDIMAETGTSVIAASPGTIERLFLSDAGGKTIYVRSTDGGTIYYYAHLSDYAPGLREGQRIRRGQRIGTVGSSGNADPEAPHLHFAILRTTASAKWWEPANPVNPYSLLNGGVTPE